MVNTPIIPTKLHINNVFSQLLSLYLHGFLFNGNKGLKDENQ
ncbi:hypothetical protein EMA8858_02890 [Emticicia aquatica]|uniref:Uncharacterized protein n=1 Tax=Emticicia aquatica TaxID=1681835 RepID=A0ABM9AS07_9BACT|nr:hypothetical protein EMA8858_02890 [Emticicia aquatica]